MTGKYDGMGREELLQLVDTLTDERDKAREVIAEAREQYLKEVSEWNRKLANLDGFARDANAKLQLIQSIISGQAMSVDLPLSEMARRIREGT